MRTIFLIFIALFIFNITNAQSKKNPVGAVVINGGYTHYEDTMCSPCFNFFEVEIRPEFPGGNDSLYKYLKGNIKYPENEIIHKIEGTVYIQFDICKNGAIKNVSCKRGISNFFDVEAIRVVKNMPAWIPGKKNGKNVCATYILPLKFNLPDY